MKRLLFVFPFGLLLACSANTGSSASNGGAPADDPDGVWSTAPAASPDTSEVTGVWESASPLQSGKLESVTRFELRADHVVAAARCTTTDGSLDPVVAGARVPAKVSSDAIVIDEKIEATKQMGSVALCGLRVAAGTLPVCAEGTAPAARKMCFVLEDGKLTLYQASGALVFDKIAD